VHQVAAFVEKPDAATAARYVADGYLWNSGNFMFRSDTLMVELARLQPEMAKAVAGAVDKAASDLGFVRLDADAFGSAPPLSIDYAVMERTDRAAVVEGTFRWSDIGSWDAVREVSPLDDAGNALSGPAVAFDVGNSMIHAERALTAVVGLKDVIVVSTPDAVLVLPRSRAEDVKTLVAQFKQQDRGEVRDHRRCWRPWGNYESIDAGARFQVKRIVVNPGGKLSLQKHHHRAEHWVVVRGTAEVTIGNEVRTVHENESVYIPIGAVHRLANPGRIALELIEVQTGSYLGEDDIVRLEDVYRRS
jgi:mannose-1-phosphate guanylyltransferase/mannose-6-phosphate isomerase